MAHNVKRLIELQAHVDRELQQLKHRHEDELKNLQTRQNVEIERHTNKYKAQLDSLRRSLVQKQRPN